MPPITTRRRLSNRGQSNNVGLILFFIASGLTALLYPLAFLNGGFLTDYERFSALPFLLVLLLAALLSAGIIIKFKGVAGKLNSLLIDLSLCFLFVLSSYALIYFEPQYAPDLYPLLFLAVALISAFYNAAVAYISTGYAIAINLLLTYTSAKEDFSGVFAVLFILLFAALFRLFTHAQIVKEKFRGEREISSRLEKIEQEAIEYRLVTSILGEETTELSHADKKLRRQFSSVSALKSSIYDILSVLKTSLSTNTCALYLIDSTGEFLKLKECVSEAPEALAQKIPAAEGLVGSVVKHKTPALVENLKMSQGGVNYYSDAHKIRSFIAYPLLENEFVRGVIFCDSEAKKAFEEKNLSLMEAASRQIMSAISSERLLNALDAEKGRKEKFYRASSRLNTALTLGEVYKMLFETGLEIAAPDFMAIVLSLDEEKNAYGIVATEGDEKNKLLGKRFYANNGIVSSAIKTGAALPHGKPDASAEKNFILFFEGEEIPPLKSLKAIPLIAQDIAIGAFVVGGKRRDALTRDEVDMLTVIANQAAVSISNAKMYQKMEQMAVTDGLTGLFNHRSLQEKLNEFIARADRSEKPFAFMLTDIDHFKKINDTYGHPMGDEVLRQVAKTLSAAVRDIDVTARYGGEEFAVLMEMTDAKGALKMAERIRKEIKTLKFTAPEGKFSITLSLGVAVYPTDAAEKQTIIDLADEGLYYAKEHGRDQAVHIPSVSP